MVSFFLDPPLFGLSSELSLQSYKTSFPVLFCLPLLLVKTLRCFLPPSSTQLPHPSFLRNEVVETNGEQGPCPTYCASLVLPPETRGFVSLCCGTSLSSCAYFLSLSGILFVLGPFCEAFLNTSEHSEGAAIVSQFFLQGCLQGHCVQLY